jgi:hypothetical protein
LRHPGCQPLPVSLLCSYCGGSSLLGRQLPAWQNGSATSTELITLGAHLATGTVHLIVINQKRGCHNSPP